MDYYRKLPLLDAYQDPCHQLHVYTQDFHENNVFYNQIDLHPFPQYIFQLTES